MILERYATDLAKNFRRPFVFSRPNRNPPAPESATTSPRRLVLLTNGIGGMARLCVDLGRVNSKYDCVLGANLNPTVPVDRHIFVKRIRVWVNADGFISPLDFKNLASFKTGPPAVWNFVANAGDGRTVEIELRAEMLAGKNTTRFSFQPARPKNCARQTIARRCRRAPDRARGHRRPEFSPRNQTQRRRGFSFFHPTPTRSDTETTVGFAFTPAPDRQLRVFADAGDYHPQPEWCENIPHPVEQTRGQIGSGDAYSPGWFEIPLAKGRERNAGSARRNWTTPKS